MNKVFGKKSQGLTTPAPAPTKNINARPQHSAAVG
jgi:hypothetical protein